MPELPEVETVRRGMELALKGDVIARVNQRREGLRLPFPKGLVKALQGQEVIHFGRRAKYILMQLANGQTVVLHLGMSGRILLLPSGHDHEPQKHDHLVVDFKSGARMVFTDPRRFGMVLLANDNDVAALPSFAGLGPEPLDNSFSGPVLHEALRRRKTSLKAALMDQRVVAGLGNIYVCEALFYAGLNPERQASGISRDEAEKLVRSIRKVLNDAIAAGGSTLRDHRQANGDLGYFQHSFAVYDRAGKACPGCSCDVSRTGGIKKITQGGRSTYYCPQKQKKGRGQ